MKFYMYQNTIDVVKTSSSGGAFKRICQEIAGNENQVIYYGVVWSDKDRVCHKRIDTFDNISSFSGSKYSRSKVFECYNDVKRDLVEGKKVVFSGVPCQIAALKLYLDNLSVARDKLTLIDIICHGTPKQIILDEWITWLERKYNGIVEQVSFRDKSIGWKGYPTRVVFHSGKSVLHNYDTQLFIRLFLSQYVMADSCYKCPFSTLQRESDITMGDFWGIEDVYPDINPGKGISLILANSDIGVKLIEQIQSRATKSELIKEIDERFIKYQQNLISPTSKPSDYQQFWDDYRRKGFEFVINKYGFYTRKGKLKYYAKVLLKRVGIYNKDFI